MSAAGPGEPVMGSDGMVEETVTELRRLLAESDAQLHDRMEELVTAAAERRHLQADLVVTNEYAAHLRARVAELEAQSLTLRARVSELEDGGGFLPVPVPAAGAADGSMSRVAAGLQAEVGVLLPDARRWDRLRRGAHHVPGYLSVVRPIGLRLHSRYTRRG